MFSRFGVLMSSVLFSPKFLDDKEVPAWGSQATASNLAVMKWVQYIW